MITSKTTLKVGEKLVHAHRGIVVYDETCDALEKKFAGAHDTLMVADCGEVIEVSLCLISRKHGNDTIRMVPVIA